MKLQLKEMGCRIKEGCGNGTDLINYRLRAEFTDKNGIKVCCDFGGWQRRDASKKGCPVVQPNALHVDGCYHDPDGTGRDYGYRLRENGFDFSKYDFTKAGVLAFVNAVTGGRYTEIEYIQPKRPPGRQLRTGRRNSEDGRLEREMKMGKTNIDMWYGDKPEQVTGLDIYFNDLGGFYSGNLRIFGKIVGDYYADSVQDIEKAFPHIAKDIENCLN